MNCLIDIDFELGDELSLFFVPMIIGFIIFGVVTVFIITMIVRAVKRHKTINTGIGEIFNKTIDLANQKLDEQLSSKNSVCEYCGSSISKDKNECQSCGAKKRINE